MITIFFRKVFLALSVLIVINIYSMDFEREVANNLAISCMMQFLKQNKNIPIVNNYKAYFSEQELLNSPKNCCAMAVIDRTARIVNYFSYEMLTNSIKNCHSACIAGKDQCAVFISNFDNRQLKDNILRLYKQYFRSITDTTVLETIPDIMSNVRKSDSEQLMLLALEPQGVRNNLFRDMNIDNDIRLIVYSLRNSCQHCHFMLSGFLKEMLETQKLRSIDFFFSFSAGTNYGIKTMEIRKNTSLCLILPLFCNIPFTNEESIRSLLLADCLISDFNNSILFPGKVNNPIMKRLIFQQAGIVFQNNLSKQEFATRFVELIPTMDQDAFQLIAKNILMELWNRITTDANPLNQDEKLLLIKLLSKIEEIKAYGMLNSLDKIHIVKQDQQLVDICGKLGLLKG